jgi:hypothetical protein
LYVQQVALHRSLESGQEIFVGPLRLH